MTNPPAGTTTISTCQPCDSACTSCTGKEITTCTGCKKGWFFASQALHGQTGCVTCHENCEECNGPGVAGCTKCKTRAPGQGANVPSFYNAGVTSTGNAECVALCSSSSKPNTWGDDTDWTCKACSAGCTTCMNANECQGCQPDGYQLNQASKTLSL